MRASSIIKAKCPACHQGSIMRGPFSMNPRCPVCSYNFDPGNGFYLGAQVVSYLLTAMLTIPPMVILKLMDVDIQILVVFPLVEFLFLGTFLTFYSRVIWLHIEHRITERLDGSQERTKSEKRN